MAEEADVTDFIRTFVEAVNRGEIDTALAAFADDACIVEDLAPFRWQGPGAGGEWLAAMGANAARLGVDAIHMALGDPMRIEVEGPNAYAVWPGTVTLGRAGDTLQEKGVLTFVLRASDGAWSISALTWSGSRMEPAG